VMEKLVDAGARHRVLHISLYVGQCAWLPVYRMSVIICKNVSRPPATLSLSFNLIV
jgi:hypothetical protein